MTYLEGRTPQHLTQDLNTKYEITEAIAAFMELKRNTSIPSAEKPIHLWLHFETLLEDIVDSMESPEKKDSASWK